MTRWVALPGDTTGKRATETERGIFIAESPLVAVIKGGNREVPRGAWVVLDASLSLDPDALARGEPCNDSEPSLLLFS